MQQRVLITGAGGRIGRMLRARLARPGRHLRLLDLAGQEPPAPGEAAETLTGDLTDADLVSTACAGVDAVLHLGGLASENTWENLLRVNIDGTRTVLAAAQRAGVPRVVLASSIHAAGFYRRPGGDPQPPGVPVDAGPDGVPAEVAPRPDTYYGVSKAAVEALGSLYADRFPMTVLALRIGSCFPEPPGEWALHSWLSPDDCARLMEACLTTEATGYRVIWGVSRNTRRWWSLAAGADIGYHPQDDAEAYAGKVPAAEGARAATIGLLGGHAPTLPLGRPR